MSSKHDVVDEAVEAAKTAMAEHIPGCGPRPAAFSPDINSAAWAAIEAAAPALRKQERQRVRKALEELQTYGLCADREHPGFSEVGAFVNGSFLHRGQVLDALEED